ncbi:MAG TPA: sterol desaturase family protein [Chryseolinea sp.]|nr:sterol desaturase family protein [Chryseolinea sp.]HPH45358.1 sterol desaturase family protein [Chryseolinea sp.]HPM28711.1 sterol desaturase family protein [Chryseolinea sp.]
MNSNIYALLTPIALGFILIEMALCWYYKKKYISFQEAVANFGTALGNQTMNVLVAAGVYIVYGWLWENYRIIETIEMNAVTFILLLLGIDFIFYWVHRWGHHINIMWAAHSPHHSAEEMNFFVALRASVTQRLFSFMFFWPLTIIGFKPVDIYAMTGLHLFISFLHHTEFIPKLWRWIEFIFTTPSHHRVHHGINFAYLDKNYGEFLIIWDRIFDSYAEEEEKVIYGMYSPPKTWNPITINFHYYQLLWKDAMAASHWLDKFKIWFMPLGWRPQGLPPKPALQEVTEQNQIRFSTTMFTGAKPYLIVHILLGVVLMMMVINPSSPWSTAQRWIGSFMLWHMIINWSGIMESKKWLYISEMLRLTITCLLLIYFSGQPPHSPFNLLWIVLSIVSSFWVNNHFKQERIKDEQVVKT